MQITTEVGHLWFTVLPILKVMLFQALAQEWTRLAELLQTNDFAGGRRIKEAMVVRVNVIDHLCIGTSDLDCISVADGLNTGLQAQGWHTA